MVQNYDYLLKVIAVGDAGVGKTALSVRFTDGIFKDDYKMTIGVGFSIKMIDVDGQRVKLQIWDTGGQEQFSYVRPLYYNGSFGGLIVFDKTDRQSFINLSRWFKEVYDNVGGMIPLILVGNKIDLPDIQVTTKEATNIAKKYNTPYFESSAKSGTSVELIFESLVRMIIDPKYADKLGKAGVQVEYDQSKIITKKAFDMYNDFANKATICFQVNDKLEALKFLKKALSWAKKASFDAGIRWCEDQIVFIAQLLNVPPPKQIEGIIMTCQACDRYFTVRSEGDFVCPKCYSNLKKVSSNGMKV